MREDQQIYLLIAAAICAVISLTTGIIATIRRKRIERREK